MRRLSGGQRRRLDLALALAGDPDLIFLDEPTTGFDPESRRRCWAAIENLRSLGKTIVLTTHYLDEAERLADRVAILQDGRIQVAGTVRQVARQAGVPTTITFTAPERVRSTATSRRQAASRSWSPARSRVCRTPSAAVALRELLAWAAANDLGDLDDLVRRNPHAGGRLPPARRPEGPADQSHQARPPRRPPGAARAALVLAQRRVRAVHLRAAARAAAAHRVDHRHGVPAGHPRQGADDLRARRSSRSA